LNLVRRGSAVPPTLDVFEAKDASTGSKKDMDDHTNPARADAVRPGAPREGFVLFRLRDILSARPTVRKMFGGGAMLGVEQVLRMVLGLFVGAWVARHLGPANFGLLNGALAVVAVAGVVASLGLSSILVRDLATSPPDEGEILGTSFVLRLAASSVLWLVCVGIAWSGVWAEAAHGLLLPVAALALVAQSMDVVERKLQSQEKLKQLTVIRCVAMLITFGMRAGLILSDAPLEAFALAGVCEMVAAAAGLGWMIRRGRGGFGAWSFSAARARAFLREGLPLMIAGLATQIQGYSDQIMMGAMEDSSELGQYAAALRIVIICSFPPLILQMIAAPEIARARQIDEGLYRRRLHDTYRAAMLLAIATTVPLVVFGPVAVTWLFGDAYRQAGWLLPLFGFRLFLTNMGVARAVFLNTEGMSRFTLVTSVIGAAVNVGLNLFLIPRWGVTGALIASSFSFALTAFGLEWMDRRASGNLRLMVSAMARPWRAYHRD
jgi:PST family polysaccharide transporter